MTTAALPPHVRFGTATAAYQIEGGVAEGGRGPSIWDTFSHTPGAVERGESGDVACDHFHRWREDVAHLARLGVDAYRLSISWSRVMPGGRGAVNPEGVAFYRELLTALRAAGISPWVTLYHWDLPQELEDAGGWPVRATAEAFADYARAMARELGDLVDVWTTLNEPWCSAFLGYASGVHAPGKRDGAQALAAAHHLNLAHGLAVRAIREELGEETRCSVTLNVHVTRPEDPDDMDHLAAVRAIDLVGNHVFLGPMLVGGYPPELVAQTRAVTDWSFVRPGDTQACRVRIDTLGVNYYFTQTVRPASPDGPVYSGGHGDGAASRWVGADHVEFLPPRGELTDMGWNVDPSGLVDLLTGLAEAYPDLPLAVTENGAAMPDECDGDAVHDPRRIAYVEAHLGAVASAIAAGADVRAYFLWSLMDNFEWAYGYAKRFGILRVEPETLERRWKDSAHWYARVIADHRAGRDSASTPDGADQGGADRDGAEDVPAASPGRGWRSWLRSR